MASVQLNFLDELPIIAANETAMRKLYMAHQEDAERQRIEAKFAPLLHDEPHLGKLVSYVGKGKYGRMPVRESVLIWTKSIVCLC